MINSRTKGHSFERQVASDLREVGFKDAKRLLEYQEGFGIDIAFVEPLRIQCKVGKSHNIENALKEAEGVGYPVAVCKKDRKRATATLYWDDFLIIVELLKKEKIW